MNAPDLLKRFTAAPFVFSLRDAGRQVRIETNDLGMALAVRRLSVTGSNPGAKSVVYWKLIRDRTAPTGEFGVAWLFDGPLRAAKAGKGTLVIYDEARHEMLGFIAPDVSLERLFTQIIPCLLNGREASAALPTEALPTPLSYGLPARRL